MIERIERLSINDEAPPADQPVPSRKIPKWDTKTLESVHPYEVGKTGTRSLKRHEDGGGEDNSGDDMDVSFDCEFNLYVNFEPTPFIEVDACNE